MADDEGAGIENLTCARFLTLTEAEQRAFVIGVANGRGLTAGMFEAYAGAAKRLARTAEEREAIAASFETIYSMISPMLGVDVQSLWNGIRAACTRPEFRDEFVISALGSVHLDIANAINERRADSN
jgi:hypothetical protein